MEPGHYLRCLSQPTLFGPGGEPIKFKVRKHFALLVYLAVHARVPQRRDHLAELLWGSARPDEARHSLATALSVIRGKLGPGAIEKTTDSVRFAHPAFLTDLERLAAGDLFAGEGRPTLEVAGFLDGFEVADAHEFMLWKEGQHARWLPEIRTALVRLMDRCRRTGDSRQIEHLADRMLLLDELSEEGIRAKMEARAFAGDRLTALRVYEAWQARLAEELGAQPSALVEGMAMRLRQRGWERPVESPIATVPTHQWKNRPFIGRAHEYRALYEGWEATQRGEAGHVLLLGESGIGKSTLAERLTTAAGLEGASVARVQCYEAEKEIPYTAVGGLVHLLLDRPGASATPPEALAELSRTVAEVRRRFPSIPPAFESQGEAVRVRLAEAFYELLVAVAEEHPLILVVDDLHQTDDASLAVLHLVLRKARGQAVLVLLLARSSELLESPNASRLYEHSEALGIRILEVATLAEDEAAEMVDSLLEPYEPQPGPTIRRSLLRASAGYPMVLELLLRDWQACGDQCLALSVSAMTEEPGTGGPGIAVYRIIVDRITRSLDPAARAVLNLAAILGNRLNDLELYSLVDLTTGQTLFGMTRLSQLRLLGDGENGLEFVNELVRAHAYIAVPSPVRKVLHGRVANRLLERHLETNSPTRLELAWHLIRSGQASEAIPHLLDGAEGAIAQGALHEAERGLSEALPLLHGATLERAVLLLSEVLHNQGRWQESLEVLDTPVSRGADSAWQATGRAERAFALETLNRLKLEVVSSHETLTLIDNLISTARASKDPRTSSLCARALAVFASHHPTSAQWSEVITAIRDLPTPEWPRPERVRLLTSLVVIGFRAQQLNEVERWAKEARGAIDPSLEPNSLAAEVLSTLGCLACAAGDYVRAREGFLQAINLYKRLGNDPQMRVIAANVALCSGRLACYEDQITWSNLALGGSGKRHQYNMVLALYTLASGLVQTGRLRDALDSTAQLADLSLDGAAAFVDQARHLYLAEIYEALGKSAESMRAGRQGTTGRNADLHLRSFAGLFAKWLSKTTNSSNLEEYRQKIAELLAVMDTCDSVDRDQIRNAAEAHGVRGWLDRSPRLAEPSRG